MSPLLSATLITGLSLLTMLAGHWLARRPGKGWLVGTLLALAWMLSCGLVINVPRLSCTPPFSWVQLHLWAVISISAALLLGVLAARVDKASLGRSLRLLTLVVIARTGVLPAIAPMMSHAELSKLKTMVDRDGICLQGTDYTCGPACAVTALKRLGISSQEGDLSLYCGTGKLIGTPDPVLEARLRERYGPQGLIVERRWCQSVDELKDWPVAIAVVKYAPFLNHYVTVLEVGPEKITIGDPLCGKCQLTREEFQKKWLNVTLLLKRAEAE